MRSGTAGLAIISGSGPGRRARWRRRSAGRPRAGGASVRGSAIPPASPRRRRRRDRRRSHRRSRADCAGSAALIASSVFVEPVSRLSISAQSLRWPAQLAAVETAEHRQMADDVADDRQLGRRHVWSRRRRRAPSCRSARRGGRASPVPFRRLLRRTDQDARRRCQASDQLARNRGGQPSTASPSGTRATGTPRGNAASSRDGNCRSSIDEDAAVVGAADQPAIGLAQPQPGDAVVVGGAAEHRLARAVQDVGARPRHPVEDDQPQRAARHVDPVAHRVGAEQAGILLGAEDVDQRRGRHRVDMLGEQQQALALRAPGRCAVHRAQPADRGEEAERAALATPASARRSRRRPGRDRRAGCR